VPFSAYICFCGGNRLIGVTSRVENGDAEVVDYEDYH
jgi:hypothetical protein